MKIATWNVNSLNVRLPQVSDWLAAHQPDILVLQELKLEQDKYPAAAFRMMGWHGKKPTTASPSSAATRCKTCKQGCPRCPTTRSNA